MILRISPDPSPEERAAIEAALAARARRREPSAWWRVGVVQALGVTDELELARAQATTRPRSILGARRA